MWFLSLIHVNHDNIFDIFINITHSNIQSIIKHPQSTFDLSLLRKCTLLSITKLEHESSSCNAFLRIISISDERRDASADEELVRRTFRDIADT